MLEVGLLKRTFDEYDVRFIAANDNFDTANGFDIMSIFRDVFNEWFVADTSKKIRAVFKAKAQAGKHSNSVAPYGYKPSDTDKFVWAVDDPAAEVVRDIFQMCIDGIGPKYIAKELGRRGLKIPQVYKAERDGVPLKHIPKYPDTDWHASVVNGILTNREYTGRAKCKKRGGEWACDILMHLEAMSDEGEDGQDVHNCLRDIHFDFGLKISAFNNPKNTATVMPAAVWVTPPVNAPITPMF